MSDELLRRLSGNYTGPIEMSQFRGLQRHQEQNYPPFDPDARYRLAQPEMFPCPHRGPKVGEELCGGCLFNRKMIDVFACKLHGECSLYMLAKRRVKICARCEDLPGRRQR